MEKLLVVNKSNAADFFNTGLLAGLFIDKITGDSNS